MVAELGPNNVEPYLDDPDFTVQFQPAVSQTVQVIYPNLYPQTMPDGSPNPFLDFRVRRAANHAINRLLRSAVRSFARRSSPCGTTSD